MYKNRRKILKKKKEEHIVANTSDDRIRKIEGNPNITSKRLTIPHGFLSLGIKSETSRRPTSKRKILKDSDCIIREDLHGLFNAQINLDKTSLSRSARMPKSSFKNFEDLPVSGHFKKITNDPVNTPEENTNIRKTIQKDGKQILKNRSRSLFREINEKYAQLERNNISLRVSSRDSSTSSTLWNKEFQGSVNSDFCQRVRKQLVIDVQKEALSDCKSKIQEKIKHINKILSGKRLDSTITSENKRDNFQANLAMDSAIKNIKYDYVPKSQWVYQTPPRQKICMPKLQDCQIQPAVICSTKKQSNIYEIKPNVHVDLTNFKSRQDIQYDGRFMNHIGTIDNNENMDLDEDESIFPIFQSQGCDTRFKFVKPVIPVQSDHFINLASRPKKNLPNESRMHNILKRKLDDCGHYESLSFEAQPSSSSNYSTELSNKDFTFSQDESKHRPHGPLHFTPSGDSFQFEAKRKLFSNFGDNLFRFKKNEEGKLFDFSQLRHGES